MGNGSAATGRPSLAGRLTARSVHTFVGMGFSLILLFVALTGTLSVYSTEIDWLTRPAMRAAPLAEEKRPLGESFDAMRAALPDWRPVALLRYPSRRYADQITAVTPAGQERLVFVDPYRGQVQGTGSAQTVKTVLREMHRALSSRRTLVKIAVAAVSLPLAVAVIAGLFMYRRFWTGFFRKPRLSGSRRAMLSDLHRLAGVWLLPFLVLTAATGLVFLVEMLGVAPQMREAPRLSERAEALPPGFDGAALDRAVAAAGAALPGFALREVRLPARTDAPLALRGADGTLVVRPDASAVYLDPLSLTPRDVQPAATMGPHLRLFEAVRVLHYGTVGGQATRLLWLIFGLTLVGLGVLGAMIYGERMLKEARVRGLPQRSRLGHYWAGMGWGRWLGLAVLAFALAMTLRRLM